MMDGEDNLCNFFGVSSLSGLECREEAASTENDLKDVLRSPDLFRAPCVKEENQSKFYFVCWQ